MLSASVVQAGRYDLHLGRFCNPTTPCAPTVSTESQTNFNKLMKELGLITAPVFLAPAETLGLNGFSFGLEATLAPINNGEDYWSVPTEGAPDSMIFIPRLHIRKGLPFSFEVGTQLSYLSESELFIIGGEAKWALNEGFYYFPDVAFRFALNHMLGSKDFSLTNFGWDVSISKAFGIGGMMSLTPYAGYNMLFIDASSHVVLSETADGAMDAEALFSGLNWKDNQINRFFVGCRLKTHIFQIVAEGIFSSESVNVFSFKIGFDY
jgi:hypothetical protein